MVKNALQAPRLVLSPRKEKAPAAPAEPVVRSVVQWSGHRIRLTPLEARLWAILRHAAGEVVPHRRLKAYVWEGREAPLSKAALDVLVLNLRAKVPGGVVSVRGQGFRLGEQDPWSAASKKMPVRLP